ncbi:hypothetical protein K469DRAFT_754839 [Zopfia rhizophila CBS 207.26]|uniref:Uncharacterized protein n=1 Tax=Zopfia rhizophila CBS 207.26 TaxID=1314779 RepID=A0A6A6DHJ5_9PEZI|nr:hypothetical protein K469DRAFT_754839 [Zopfia rhizophila CBS 207.26]
MSLSRNTRSQALRLTSAMLAELRTSVWLMLIPRIQTPITAASTRPVLLRQLGFPLNSCSHLVGIPCLEIWLNIVNAQSNACPHYRNELRVHRQARARPLRNADPYVESRDRVQEAVLADLSYMVSDLFDHEGNFHRDELLRRHIVFWEKEFAELRMEWEFEVTDDDTHGANWIMHFRRPPRELETGSEAEEDELREEKENGEEESGKTGALGVEAIFSQDRVEYEVVDEGEPLDEERFLDEWSP